MREEWRDIKGYEGKYQVSNLGRVKSLKRKCYAPQCGGERTVNERILKTSLDGQGYPYILLPKNKFQVGFTVHRLVWEAFGNKTRGRGFVIDHINGDKTDNNIKNLQLLTSRDNIAKGYSEKRELPTGVSYRKDSGKYRSKIVNNKKAIYLGNFNCPTAASLAYQKALRGIQ